jgi:hypothetical protein
MPSEENDIYSFLYEQSFGFIDISKHTYYREKIVKAFLVIK